MTREPPPSSGLPSDGWPEPPTFPPALPRPSTSEVAENFRRARKVALGFQKHWKEAVEEGTED